MFHLFLRTHTKNQQIKKRLQYYATDSRIATTTVTAAIGVKANDKAGTGVTMGASTIVSPWTPTGTAVSCAPICKLQNGAFSNVGTASVTLNADGSFSITLPSGANAAVYYFKYNLAGTDAASNPLTPVTALVRVDAYNVNQNNFVSGEDDVYYVVAGQSYSGLSYTPWLNNDNLKNSGALPAAGLQVLSYSVVSLCFFLFVIRRCFFLFTLFFHPLALILCPLFCVAH